MPKALLVSVLLALAACSYDQDYDAPGKHYGYYGSPGGYPYYGYGNDAYSGYWRDGRRYRTRDDRYRYRDGYRGPYVYRDGARRPRDYDRNRPWHYSRGRLDDRWHDGHRERGGFSRPGVAGMNRNIGPRSDNVSRPVPKPHNYAHPRNEHSGGSHRGFARDGHSRR